MYKPTYLVCCLLALLCACQTAAQRKAAERATVNKRAADEINRICSLPPAEREVELKKIKEESGMVLYCGGAE
jgi:hypothetical protein